MAVAQTAVAGIDIGTTSVKAVLLSPEGQRIASYAQAYPTHRPGPGLVEQAPADWLRHVTAALAAFAEHGTDVKAIGITSQVNTHVFAGADLAPLCPALVWQDARAAPEAAAIDEAIDPADKIAWLGAPIPVDASHALARIAWMAQHHPQVWSVTRAVMAPKDWVIARLTGAVQADPLASVGLVGTDLRYATALIARVPGAAAVLPTLADPLSMAGRMLAGPFKGVPVVTGTMDAWASMFGLGVATQGQGFYLSGTSEVLGLLSPTRLPVPGVVTFPQWAGLVLHAGPTQAGGASLDWLARLTGRSAAELGAMAAPITATSPLFLPHLQGERAPLWDAATRGTFAGLTLSSDAEVMASAVMEGVAFSARWALEAVEASGAQSPAVLQSGGGGMQLDRWCQIRADALARPLQRMQAADAGAIGAAVMAGVGTGLLPDLAAAARSLVQPDRRFDPEPAASALANHRFALFKQLYHTTKPVNAALT